MAITVSMMLLVATAMVGCNVVAGAGDNSCAGRCGPGTDSSKPCQCNAHCLTYNDCCHDYQQMCVATCVNRCGSVMDSSRPCQCNTQCERYGDCCDDYQQVCVNGDSGGGACEALADVTEYFWANDVNRMTSSEYTADWQAQVSDGNTADMSPGKLFSFVDQSVFNAKPTFAAFLALLDNYDSFIGTSDFLSSAEKAEMDDLYSLLRATAIFNKLYEFLLCKGHVSSDEDFKTKFYNLWFDLYPRSSSASAILDSSGFEHVMVGELRVSGGSKSVSGFHSWLQFYQEERLGRINYFGYVRGIKTVPYVIGANFAWRPSTSSRDATKALGSFFLGSSPEFDLAIYTICAFESPNSICNVRLGGASLSIQTWDVNHKSGLQIGSSYPAI
ncbi:uridylate-specific endoribonuclease D-like [Babylonia areolata]|uniref:uridylate-specific endoribonuclease D-like n=1 Tax=Babylonia areolata TaxID=304850 RepID=UPI003FD213C5